MIAKDHNKNKKEETIFNIIHSSSQALSLRLTLTQHKLCFVVLRHRTKTAPNIKQRIFWRQNLCCKHTASEKSGKNVKFIRFRQGYLLQYITTYMPLL